jgi:hypothetical protein
MGVGRKSWDKELEMKTLWDLSTQVLKFGLKNDKVSIDKKMEIASHLIGKMIPKEQKLDFAERMFNFIVEKNYNQSAATQSKPIV